MILTVTANTAIDRTYEIDSLTVGAVHKVARVYSHIGGKGVNVSQTVHALGGETLVTGLLGQDRLEQATHELSAAGLRSALFPVSGAARQTVTVTTADGTTTAFDEVGPTVSAQEWTDFEHHFGTLLQDAGMVVIAGSLPPGSDDEALARLCREANHHGVPVVLDARGAAMRAAQDHNPLVAKLNRDELEQTLNRPLPRDADVLEGAHELRGAGARQVVVTLGPDGALGLGDQGAWRITHSRASGNPIGAGDAFSAALAMALLDEQPFPEALRRGAAAALASLRTPTAGRIEPDAVREALAAVKCTQVAEVARR